ncbi:hypothetical protein L596_021212 [Steinernema carpocapsae]|uniref:Uncharacterized protein n=1 Tax=Steinernema carpocapsae TaxID=34508 RepID=A0A4U5MVS8_STECR|nr:hypothetical protein L596_021212 [Steinernema carpocapsae]
MLKRMSKTNCRNPKQRKLKYRTKNHIEKCSSLSLRYSRKPAPAYYLYCLKDATSNLLFPLPGGFAAKTILKNVYA